VVGSSVLHVGVGMQEAVFEFCFYHLYQTYQPCEDSTNNDNEVVEEISPWQTIGEMWREPLPM